MKFKIIFLDIDGVMNALERDKIRIKKGLTWVDVEPEFANNLLELINKHKAKIVLSSSWRFHENWKQDIIDIFATSGYKLDPILIIDRTPINRINHRGQEILQWLNENLLLVENYVILDDDKRVLIPKHNSHVVLCDNGMGLTQEKAKLADQILSVNAQ